MLTGAPATSSMRSGLHMTGGAHRRAVLKGLAGAGLSAGILGQPALAQTPPGRWLRVESANFIAFSTASEDSTRAEIAALEAFHAILSRLQPPEDGYAALKLTVYLAGTERDFQAAWPGAPETVAGFYSATLEEVYAVTSPQKGRERQNDVRGKARALDARAILFHEYAHHFMMANQRLTFPAWYVEGFAEFLSSADFSEKGLYLGKFTASRARWLAAGEWMPIETFLTRSPHELSDEDNQQFYAQAWLATHFLMNTPERAKGFDRYIRITHAGGDLLGAFEPSFGVKPEVFDKELRDYKRKPIEFRFVPELRPDLNLALKIDRLSRAADDLLMPCVYLRAGNMRGNPDDSVKAVRAAARKFPDDPFAMRSLALAEVWHGDLAAARTQLDALLKIDADRPEVHHLSGLCDLRLGYVAEDDALIRRARASFAAAHRMDGTRASSLFRYVECSLLAKYEIDAHLLDVLLAAYQLTPQVDMLALMLAQGLTHHMRFEEAATVLRPIAADSHGGEMSSDARQYLALAIAGTAMPNVLYGGARVNKQE